MLGGGSGKLRIVGAHTHKPARGRNLGHRHELVFALPFIAECSTALGQRFPDECFLGIVLKQQFFVHAVGNKTPGLVERKAVTTTPHAYGVETFFRKICPAGANCHCAQKRAVLAVHSLGNHKDQRIARGGLHHAFTYGHILATEYLPGIVFVRPVTTGQVGHIGIYPGHNAPLEVKEQKRPVPRQVFNVAAQQFLCLLGLPGKGILHRFLAGQNGGNVYRLIDVYFCRAGHDLAGFFKGFCLHARYHVIGRSGHVENQHGDHDNSCCRDRKCANALDTDLAHE